MSNTKRILLPLLIIFSLFIIYFLYISLSDYKPEEATILTIYNNQVKNITKDKPLKIATFNIGFAGLDKDRDLYEKGGNSYKAESEEKVFENLESIVEIIDSMDPDFFMIQELDIDSSRSYKIDQLSYLDDKYPNYGNIYGDNYNIKYLLKPIGKVQSGLATFSRYNATSAIRFSLPGQQEGLNKYYDYDRAFIEKRFELQNDNELVLINIHLSNFNGSGLQRFEEINFLQKYITKEYENGSYIIVGGDWNHSLPDTDPNKFKSSEAWPSWFKNFPEELRLNGFNWATEKYTPTFRSPETPYISGRNFLAVTDGFLASDNIEIIDVDTLDNRFNISYHNPVVLEFMLK